MCGNFPNIKVTEGNAFSLVLPLKKRTYESCKPIDEDIDIMSLEDVVFKFGGVEYTATLEEDGVRVSLPATLARGTYDIVLTAMYQGSEIRAAYESAVTIVAWNSQSDAQQFIPGSPIVLDAAYVIGGTLTDAELEALKEEFREKNAQLAQAIADAEAAKREWEEKAADLDGVAQEQTLTQGVQDIRDDISHINIDTTTLAKQGTNPDATLTEVQAKIGSPASGQGADLFAAMRDIALSATTLQELADAWSAMVTHRESLDGYRLVAPNVVNGIGDIMFHKELIEEIYDDTTIILPYDALPNAVNLVSAVFERVTTITTTGASVNTFRNCTSLKRVVFNSLITIQDNSINYGNIMFDGCTSLEEVLMPNLERLYNLRDRAIFRSANALRILDLTKWTGVSYQGLGLSDSVNLIDLRFGAGVTGSTTAISTWNPTNALDANSQTLLTPEDIAAGFTSNLEKLLYNIREHIAANLPVAPNTITFSADVKAAILADQPTADAFTNKNWTIA